MSKCFELVLWMDAVSVDEWTNIDDIEPGYHTIQSVGMVLMENDLSIVLALNHDLDSDNYSCIMHIPKSMIISRHIFKMTCLKDN